MDTTHSSPDPLSRPPSPAGGPPPPALVLSPAQVEAALAVSTPMVTTTRGEILGRLDLPIIVIQVFEQCRAPIPDEVECDLIGALRGYIINHVKSYVLAVQSCIAQAARGWMPHPKPPAAPADALLAQFKYRGGMDLATLFVKDPVADAKELRLQVMKAHLAVALVEPVENRLASETATIMRLEAGIAEIEASGGVGPTHIGDLGGLGGDPLDLDIEEDFHNRNEEPRHIEHRLELAVFGEEACG